MIFDPDSHRIGMAYKHGKGKIGKTSFICYVQDRIWEVVGEVRYRAFREDGSPIYPVKPEDLSRYPKYDLIPSSIVEKLYDTMECILVHEQQEALKTIKDGKIDKDSNAYKKCVVIKEALKEYEDYKK